MIIYSLKGEQKRCLCNITDNLFNQKNRMQVKTQDDMDADIGVYYLCTNVETFDERTC